MVCCCRISIYAVAWAAVLALPAVGQQSATLYEGDWNFAAWKMDQLVLRSGQTVEGLIESETEKQVRVLEIKRPQGRGIYAVNRPLPRLDIASIERISAAERKETRDRFDRYINRGRVGAVAGDKLELEAFSAGGHSGWRYRSKYFVLESHTSEELTRRFAGRLEQMFTAYRRLLPPKIHKPQELKIVIFGSWHDYQLMAQSLGLRVENAAFYHPQRNLVATGSDLARLGGQLEQVQAQHGAMRADLARLKLELPQKLEQYRRKLAASISSERERQKAVLAYRRTLEKEIADLEQQLNESDRQNEAAFQKYAGRALALLHHEAFHAYLENYVYPQSEADVPRWLNEGLAQLFEHAVVDGETLHIDVLHRATLNRLHADGASGPTPLADILRADYRSFLVPHGSESASQLHYAYAWGLSWYLALVRPVLGGAAMDQYVLREAAAEDPVARFERLVDQPLAEFEAHWRAWLMEQTGRAERPSLRMSR